ncbi:hypothetical protein PPERSA_00481 [Pseudocohnilembus persalinus]|uniref:Uncharacterized protein n=1 Tax=Pseudocohnilembus persalinus TaxID=266149 RepID=A0A0V0QHU5_PSEPJ|nr:hypothetical protein PPERSA_00481 [Pseudocohnilembus persalinus]|eukprot:KRX01859.1 hypothetical protein PPERSA_00481 [Pseudocohnilembus persalinus]
MKVKDNIIIELEKSIINNQKKYQELKNNQEIIQQIKKQEFDEKIQEFDRKFISQQKEIEKYLKIINNLKQNIRKEQILVEEIIKNNPNVKIENYALQGGVVEKRSNFELKLQQISENQNNQITEIQKKYKEVFINNEVSQERIKHMEQVINDMLIQNEELKKRIHMDQQQYTPRPSLTNILDQSNIKIPHDILNQSTNVKLNYIGEMIGDLKVIASQIDKPKENTSEVQGFIYFGSKFCNYKIQFYLYSGDIQLRVPLREKQPNYD